MDQAACHSPEPPIGSDDPHDTIARIRADMAAKGISMAKLLRRANLAESTWHRWVKRGLSPRDSSLVRIKAAAAELIDEAA